MRFFDLASQAASYMLGGLVLVLALIVMATSTSVADLTTWAWDILGLAFSGMLGGLIFLSLLCWVRVNKAERLGDDEKIWLTAGVQSANGIATLALTYTLLGISLGVGTLAEQPLTPDTVQEVIRSLTASFSLAFMTSVIGLPTSAVLRSMLLVSEAKKRNSGAGRPAAVPPSEGAEA
jgi:hypothetical protein